MYPLLPIFSLLLVSFCSFVLADPCEDGIHNVFTVDSYGDLSAELPVVVQNVKILVYDIYYKPSCYKGRVNIQMPGYFKIVSGEVVTTRDFDLFKSGMVRASVALNGRDICKEGKSAMLIVPGKICHFEITSFIPHNICHMLQTKGKHTLQDLEQQLNFNSTLELPPSPSFLGIKLLDLLNGDYKIRISVHSEGHKIVEVAMPTGYIPLQFGM